jgi:hypothetical protein
MAMEPAARSTVSIASRRSRLRRLGREG